MLADEFREGNVSAAEGNRRLIDQAYETLGPGDWEICIRSDSAAYEQENLDHWNSRGWRFTVFTALGQVVRHARRVLHPAPKESTDSGFM